MVEPVELLRRKKGDKGLREFAREVGCSPAYLSDLLDGKRMPGPKILTFLGFERVYRRKRGVSA